MCFKPLNDLVDGGHSFEFFGDDDRLFISIHLSLGEVDDFHRRDTGCVEDLVVFPLDLKGHDTPEFEQGVVGKVVFLAFEVNGAPVWQLNA